MLKDFRVDNGQQAKTNVTSKTDTVMASSFEATTVPQKVPRWRRKLFTKEDPIGVHKYLGVFCLLHFAFRFAQMYFGGTYRNGKQLNLHPSLRAFSHEFMVSMWAILIRPVCWAWHASWKRTQLDPISVFVPARSLVRFVLDISYCSERSRCWKTNDMAGTLLDLDVETL